MHTADVTIDNISKIEGSAGLEVKIEDGYLKDLKFKIQDYRRFYTQAVKGKPMLTAPSFLSRICGTCSVAHLFASIEAIEKTQGIVVSRQTKQLRRLAYNALMIRDHALHLYFFVMPDVLGIDSILDIPDDPGDAGHQLLHDSFDIKQLGTDISDVIIGAAIHAPFPTIGGFLKLPDPTKFPVLIDRLEKIRPQVVRGIKLFNEWEAEFKRNTDYLCLKNTDHWDFLDGKVVNSNNQSVAEEEFYNFLTKVVIPYSQAEGYHFSDNHEDYLVGALARLNLNKEMLNQRTKTELSVGLGVDINSAFPSNNIHDNNLAQAIEILHCVDDAIEILQSLQIVDEKPIRQVQKAGRGVGVVEAPRGILYHMAEVDEKGMIVDYDVIVPTAQNQINIENDLKKMFVEMLNTLKHLEVAIPSDSRIKSGTPEINGITEEFKSRLKFEAEKIIRAYDPCMSCATNFLKIDWIDV